jgi:hypothetical protein
VVVGFLVIWPAFTYTVLRSSRVQTFLARSVAAYLSRELDTRIGIEGVNVSRRMHIVLEGVSVDDRARQPMIRAARMVFDLGPVSVRNRHLTINKLMLEDALLHLERPANGEPLNIRFLWDYFSSDGSARDERRSWNLTSKSVVLTNASFTWEDPGLATGAPGFDPGLIRIHDLDLEVSDVFLDGEALTLVLGRMAFTDSKGFELRQLSGQLSVSPRSARLAELLLRSGGSLLSLDLALEYGGYEALEDFFHQVDIHLDIKQSRLDLEELGYFLPPLRGMDDPVILRGRLHGRGAELTGSGFYLSYQEQSTFRGGFQVNGLPHMEDIFFDFYAEDFQTTMEDLAGIRLPVAAKSKSLVIPETVMNLDRVSFRGRLYGHPGNVTAFGTFDTSLGALSTNLVLSRVPDSPLTAYNGRLSTDGFDLGRFLDEPEKLGSVSLQAGIQGEGLSLATVNMMIDGTIQALELSGYEYQQITIAGELSNQSFNGSLLVNDDNLYLDFLGMINMEEDTPVFDFRAMVDRANLTRLNLYQRDPEAESLLSTSIVMNARGAGLSSMQGLFDIQSVRYVEQGLPIAERPFQREYQSGLIRLSSTLLAEDHHILHIRSDFLDADLNGKIRFEALGEAVRGVLAGFMPSYYNGGQETAAGNLPEQDFEIDIRFKDTSVLSDLFFPQVRFSEGAELGMRLDAAGNDLQVSGRAEQFTLMGNRFVNWVLDAGRKEDRLVLDSRSERLMFSDSLFVEGFDLTGTLAYDTLLLVAGWEPLALGGGSSGSIGLMAEFLGREHARIRFLPSRAVIREEEWQVNAGNEISLDRDRLVVHDLMFFSGEQFVKVDGLFSPDPSDRVEVSFREFDFANLNLLIRARNMDFEGIINGSVLMTGLYQPGGIEGGLTVGDFAFNQVLLGDLSLAGQWEEDAGGFALAAELVNSKDGETVRPLTVSGHYYPGRREDNYDFDLLLQDLDLAIWSRYMENFTPGFHGMASGLLRLEGRTADPEISGQVFGREAGFGVDYLNTRYSFSHEVEIGKDYFRFRDLVLADSLGNTALASGTIRHQLFRDFELDLIIRPERMIVLNTNASQNELYYGRAFATGLIHIHGPEDDIVMDISARTNRGTQVFLPLSYTGELVENQFITFVTKEEDIREASRPAPRTGGLTLNFDLDVTPEAEVQLIFDSQIGDIIRGRGTGSLNLEIPSQGGFNMYGEFVIEEGDYLFTLQNLINKRFRIEQGGVISWTGDVNQAEVDLRAAYRLRTSLYDLVMDVDTSDVYRRRVPVECILVLQEELFNPSISFDIHLPGGDESTRELVERLITTEQEMNRQVFSLLVLNRFMPTTTDQYNTALGYGVGSTSSELLSNQLSNWLSQISTEFDIGINYRPGDEISSQELEVALSTQLFDDRVVIDGNVGVAGTHPTGNQRASNIIGDVNVEVKITPEGKFRVKAFNRSNTYDIINTNSPYTQGVGLFYRKEFDSLSELFRRQRRTLQSPPSPGEEASGP